MLCLTKGLFFQIETVSLTHVQCYLYKTNPNELLCFKYLIVIHTSSAHLPETSVLE